MIQPSLFSPEPASTADHSAPREGATHQAEQDVGESHVRVTSLSTAIEAGQQGMAISLEHAEQRDPGFKAKAEEAILRHLAVAPARQATGEELVDIAKAHGARPHDDRAFGSVFQALARRGQIRTVGYALRRKGHGTAGGRVWGLCQ